MSSEIELLKRRLQREQAARKQAETILEQKALELYDSNQALKKLNESLEKTIEERTFELQQSEYKYRGIMENMELGLMEVDDEQVIVRVYDTFCAMTGYKESELLGKKANEVFLPKGTNETIEKEDSKRAEGVSGVYELKIQKKDGTPLWVIISGAPIFDLDGKVTGSIGIHYDITERKKLEQELERAKNIAEEAQKAEQQFLAKMSHEIRTPLNAIIGMSHLMYDTNPTVAQQEYLSIIRSSSDLLHALISDILDLSKIQAGAFTINQSPFYLKGLIKTIQKTFQLRLQNQNVKILSKIDERLNTELIGDELLLNQILFNLMGNATKFTQEGSITLNVDVLARKGNFITIQFSVTDTGIGISEEKQAFIFDNFKQANPEDRDKFGGTGLGLAISKQLIELQQGTLSVKSKLNVGTTFSFVLTYEDTGLVYKPVLKQELANSKADFGAIDVLIAEDNYMNRKYISKLMEKWNISYAMAIDGLDALNKSKEKVFDLIFMDISMPNLNGYETTIAIRNRLNPNQATPIIALTASAMISKKAKALEIGMTDYLPKPFKPDDLLGIINKYSSNKAPENISVDDLTFEFHPSLNQSYLKEFYEGDLAYAADMFATFLEYSFLEFQSIRPLIDKKNYPKAKALAHKLKPSFAMVGLTEAEKDLAILEDICEKGDPKNESSENLTNLEHSLAIFLPILKSELTRMQAFLI